MSYYNSNVWFAARVRRNQEKLVKAKLEQLGVKNYVPFRKEVRRRKDRKVEVWTPVIPNVVFIYTDFHTGISIANDYGIKISYIKAIDGKSLLVDHPGILWSIKKLVFLYNGNRLRTIIT